MKKRIVLLGLICILLTGCTPQNRSARVLATTLPVYEFTAALCDGTGITVSRLVNESVSCLHDYSLSVSQMRAVEGAELVVQSGAGLEDFLGDVLRNKPVIDSAAGITLLGCEHEHDHDHEHTHEYDAHIWLSPENASAMAKNISAGLSQHYPQHAQLFAANLETLLEKIDAVQIYGEQQLHTLSCREMITFHDGFSYFADAFDLTILEAIEEEAGSEASAAELKHLITLAQEHSLPGVFTEVNGSVGAANILCAELGIKSYALDMAMSGESWFAAMYRNIDTVKEAMG